MPANNKTRKNSRSNSNSNNNNSNNNNSNNNNSNSNNNNRKSSGLTVGMLKTAMAGLPDRTPVYHVEFGGVTRSVKATKERKKLIIE